MKGKWIFRYVIVGILLAGSLFWCLYCNGNLSEINAFIASEEYINLALHLSPKAVELLEQRAQIEKILGQSYVVLGIAGGVLLCMILWQILAPVVAKKKAAKAAALQMQPTDEPKA